MSSRIALLLALALVLTACGRGTSDVEPGPGRPDDTSSTTTSTEPPSDDLETASSVKKTTTTRPSDPSDETTTTFIVDEASENAEAYTELAASGLVLSLEEQACADEAVRSGIDDGLTRLDALIGGVQECAAPRVIDDFAAGLLSAGGSPLPPTEAACVANRLRSGEEFRPFWAALFAEEPFDFLLASNEVQDRYLDLFSECVSVGRALSSQLGQGLSPPTVACIDDLYADREFVRVTIEADLSGDPDEIDRINRQIGTCLNAEERAALFGG